MYARSPLLVFLVALWENKCDVDSRIACGVRVPPIATHDCLLVLDPPDWKQNGTSCFKESRPGASDACYAWNTTDSKVIRVSHILLKAHAKPCRYPSCSSWPGWRVFCSYTNDVLTHRFCTSALWKLVKNIRRLVLGNRFPWLEPAQSFGRSTRSHIHIVWGRILPMKNAGDRFRLMWFGLREQCDLCRATNWIHFPLFPPHPVLSPCLRSRYLPLLPLPLQSLQTPAHTTLLMSSFAQTSHIQRRRLAFCAMPLLLSSASFRLVFGRCEAIESDYRVT